MRQVWATSSLAAVIFTRETPLEGAVYKLCEDGDLPHVRINNSIRVRPGDLAEFIAARTRAGQRTKPPPQE